MDSHIHSHNHRRSNKFCWRENLKWCQLYLCTVWFTLKVPHMCWWCQNWSLTNTVPSSRKVWQIRELFHMPVSVIPFVLHIAACICTLLLSNSSTEGPLIKVNTKSPTGFYNYLNRYSAWGSITRGRATDAFHHMLVINFHSFFNESVVALVFEEFYNYHFSGTSAKKHYGFCYTFNTYPPSKP